MRNCSELRTYFSLIVSSFVRRVLISPKYSGVTASNDQLMMASSSPAS